MVAFSLGPHAREAGYRVIGYEAVGSTNAEAMRAAANGDRGRIWFAALQQTEGRGRRGRPWHSPKGNLAASVVVIPEADEAAIATIGFVAGVAMNSALERLVPLARLRTGIDGADGTAAGKGVRIALKWPNDVLADGGKIAGILLEVHKRPDRSSAVVVGFGVNVVAAPPETPYPAISLADLGAVLDAQTVFEALSDSWVETLDEWRDGKGVSAVLARWRKMATGIGAEVAVKRDADVVRGIFETIDDTGRLIVRDSEGQRVAIAAGDVHFGTTGTLGA